MRVPKVSVVMPSYNHAKYIGRAIDSVLNQSFQDFEFLIGDDGSTDDSAEVISQFPDPRITFTQHDRNRGAAIAINELIQQCHGEYVALLHSDDLWPLDKLSYQVDVLDEHPEHAAIFGNAIFVDEADSPLEIPPHDFAQPNRPRGSWLRRFFEQGNCLCQPTVLIRRTSFDAIGVYDNRLRQLPDFDMWVRLVKRYSFFVSDRVLTYFRILPGVNASTPSPENMVRTWAEHFLIAHRFFDDVERDMLVEGFGDLLVIPELPSALHCEIEKALLFFRPVPYLNPVYRIVGLQKLEALLASMTHREVLELDYGIDDITFQQLAGRVDTFIVAFRRGATTSQIDELLPMPASNRPASDAAIGRAVLVAPAGPAEDQSGAGIELGEFTVQLVDTKGDTVLGNIVYVVGGAGSSRNQALRDFPLSMRQDGESESDHLGRMTELIEEAMTAGGTHLLVPREHTDWLSMHPMLVNYFAAQHEVADASHKAGIVIALHPQNGEGGANEQHQIHSIQTNETSSNGVIDPALFPLEFEPWTYRSLHSDLWFLTDDQLREHYDHVGRAEGRRSHTLVTREMFRDLAQGARSILEIGPFFKPLFSGTHVRYFEVLSTSELQSKARELGFNSEGVPEIDYVSATGDLAIVPGTFDVVASSHVIEHQPDLVRHLQDIEDHLNPGGYYFVWAPDRRYCFDHFRPESTVADVLEAALDHREFHSSRTIIAQRHLGTHNDTVLHWRGDHGAPGEAPIQLIRDAVADYANAQQQEIYVDAHAWQFTPSSFRQLLTTLRELGLISLEVIRVYDTLAGAGEFWALLQKPPQVQLNSPMITAPRRRHDRQSNCTRILKVKTQSLPVNMSSCQPSETVGTDIDIEAQGIHVFCEQLIAFYRYLRAEFHLRPIINVHQAILNVGGQSIELAKEVAKDYIRLSTDAIISNISCVHEATITLESDRGTFIVRDLVERQLSRIDPFHRFTNEFYTRITKSELDVLEIGSRQREKTATSFEFAGNVKSYLGLDIIAGPNVDIVGDAHQLASLVGDRSFDLVYSQWVFEHLALPWIVVSEINKVLRLGGEVVTLTNQSIGLHDLPWDFWRYSESAWRSLFNVDTGFELLETGLGEPVKITPNRYHFGFREHEGGTGFQASFARARKVCDRAPHWNVDPTTILSSLSRPYPKELTD